MTNDAKQITDMYTDEHVLMLEKGTLGCEDFETLLGDFADGDLPKTMQAMMGAHEARCEACAESKRTYLLTVRLARALKLDDGLPQGVAERLRQTLNERLGLSLKVTEPIDQNLN